MVSEDEIENIRADILIDLLKRVKIGDTHHTSLDNIPKSFPSHQRKTVKKEAKKLMKEFILDRHPTNHGIMTSINPEQLGYIINLPKVKETVQIDDTLQRFRKYLRD